MDSMISSFVDLGPEKCKPLLDHTLIADYMASGEGFNPRPDTMANKEMEESTDVADHEFFG